MYWNSETFGCGIYLFPNLEILQNKYYLVIFQVLTAARLKMTAFWDIAPCTASIVMVIMMEADTLLKHQSTSGDYTALMPESCHVNAIPNAA
jgi:hypothetical protein